MSSKLSPALAGLSAAACFSVRKLRATALTGLALLAGTASYGQYTNFMAGMDHVYPSIATIARSAPSLQGTEGYAIATTLVDGGRVVTRGEIIRTDGAGSQLWTMQYNGAGNNRFMSIETYDFSGTTNYLVVGSALNGANDQLLVACVDDNGNVIRSTTIAGTMAPNLVGLRGIPTSDGGFAIVGMECSGYSSTDQKFTVALKMDSSLNVLYYHVYESNGVVYDYDMPTNIVEGATADEFLIVGTANKDAHHNGSSLPCVMSALVDMPTGALSWSYNFSTAGFHHWDVGADAWYNAADSSFWLLSNSSVIHYYNLMHLDHNGSPLGFRQYYNPGSGDYDIYGFKLRPSLQTPGNLVIGAWECDFMTNSVLPVLEEVNPSANTVVWTNRYTGSAGGTGHNNRMMNVVENNWFATGAAAQFPFYYNGLMAYKADGNGYAIMTSDTVSTVVEAPRIWRSINQQGDVICGSDAPLADYHGDNYLSDNPLQHMMSHMPTGSYSLTAGALSYSEQRCTATADGRKVAAGNAAVNIYPNPASGSFTVESANGINTVSVTDLSGREVIRVQADAAARQLIHTGNLAPGIYMVKLEDAQHLSFTQKIQVLK